MSTGKPQLTFWSHWLTLVAAGVSVFGLVLVVAPAFTRASFSMLVYSQPHQIDGFGTGSVAYTSLTHAVLWGVMVGWGVALLFLVRELFAKGHKAGWNGVAISVLAWFVPDTAYSLLSGFWQNVVLNAVFLLLFGIALVATRSQFHVVDA